MRYPGLFREHGAGRAGATGMLAVAIVLSAFSLAPAQQSIVVSPQITELEMTPGSKKAFEVMVGNASPTSPIVVQLGVSPIAQNERGDYTVVKSENEWSCASWISVSQTTVSLAPGDAVPVRCMIQAPYTAAGSRYAAVTVAFGDPGRRTAPLSTSFEYMLGSYVEVTMVSGLARRSVDISNLKVVPVRGNRGLEDKYGDEAFFVMADVENTGNMGVIADATLRIRQQKGLLQREVPLGTGRGMVIPGATVKYRSLFTEMPPSGIYSAEATLHYGGYKPAITRMVFSVTPEGDIIPGRVESVETVGLGITPTRFDLRAGPGSRKTVGVTIHNVEDFPVRIGASKLPLSQRSDGRLVAVESPEVPSCVDWIEIEPDTFEVAGGTRKRVRVSIYVPPDAEGSAYSRLAFVPLDTDVSAQAMEESYTTDLFVSLVPDIREEIDIAAFDISVEGRFKPVACTFKIENRGNAHVDIDAEAQISSTQGPVVKDLQLEDRDTRILPGVTRTFTIMDQQGVESGTYNVELTIRIGKKRAAYETRTFSI